MVQCDVVKFRTETGATICHTYLTEISNVTSFIYCPWSFTVQQHVLAGTKGGGGLEGSQMKIFVRGFKTPKNAHSFKMEPLATPNFVKMTPLLGLFSTPKMP